MPGQAKLSSKGKLQAPGMIKMLGIEACPFCPGVDPNYHTPACETNKADKVAFEKIKKRRLMQHKKLAEAAERGEAVRAWPTVIGVSVTPLEDGELRG